VELGWDGTDAGFAGAVARGHGGVVHDGCRLDMVLLTAGLDVGRIVLWYCGDNETFGTSIDINLPSLSKGSHSLRK
jgi:hypothetical protein